MFGVLLNAVVRGAYWAFPWLHERSLGSDGRALVGRASMTIPGPPWALMGWALMLNHGLCLGRNGRGPSGSGIMAPPAPVLATNGPDSNGLGLAGPWR